MRAWILLLAVLATFQPIVQVASTEDTSSRFIKAISPRSTESITTTKTTTTATPTTSSTTIALANAFNPVIDIVSLTSEQQQQQHKDQHHQHHHQHQQQHHQQHHHQHKQHHHHHHHKTTPSSAHTSTEEEGEVDVTEQLDHHSQYSVMDDMDEAPTYSNKEIISEKVKLDPKKLVLVENSLESMFNMKRPPKIDRSKIIIPDAMKKLYKQIEGHDLDTVHIPKREGLPKSSNTVRCFTHQDSKIDDRFPHHHRFRLHFDIKSIPTEEKLKAAELELSRDAISHAALNPRAANRTRYQVLVYDITRLGVRGKREPNFLLLDNKTVRLNGTGKVILDVQPAVNRWLESPKNNFGLLVEVRTMRSLKPAPHHHVRLRRSADESQATWQHRKQPLLMTYTDDERLKRVTRSKPDRRKRKKSAENCSRKDLYVDFSEVGWSDWIVAPNGYDAFFCEGACKFPLAEHLNSTNHAVVQTLVNNINPGRVPKACCVPTEYEGISMLYLNAQNQVVLKNYQDMAVVGCGCR